MMKQTVAVGCEDVEARDQTSDGLVSLEDESLICNDLCVSVTGYVILIYIYLNIKTHVVCDTHI